MDTIAIYLADVEVSFHGLDVRGWDVVGGAVDAGRWL